MSIYFLDSSFWQLFPLSQLFSSTKAKKLKKKKNLFVLYLKLNFQGNWNLRSGKIKQANIYSVMSNY